MLHERSDVLIASESAERTERITDQRRNLSWPRKVAEGRLVRLAEEAELPVYGRKGYMHAAQSARVPALVREGEQQMKSVRQSLASTTCTTSR